MDELIKREDAIEAMAELQGIAQSKAELTGISKAWKRIKVLPTVDAVPVVRCQRCKHYCGEETYTNHRICKIWNEEVFANGYCYHGERKNNETKLKGE